MNSDMMPTRERLQIARCLHPAKSREADKGFTCLADKSGIRKKKWDIYLSQHHCDPMVDKGNEWDKMIMRQDSKKLEKFLRKWNGETET